MKKKMLNILLQNKEANEKYIEETSKISTEELVKAIKQIGEKKTKHIDTEKIKAQLDDDYIGNKIYCFQEVDSTNTVAKFLAESGSDEGTVVLSETQTKGKGRNGKKWESPHGGVWLSIILKPNISPSKASFITLATGVAVTKTLRGLGVDAKIKWPNDILINNKKVSGILTEANVKSNNVNYVVVGVGIDSNLDIEEFPEDLQTGSTTLKDELKTKTDEIKLISSFLNEFKKIYDLFENDKFEEILNDWRNLSQTIGSYVEIKQPLGQSYKGYAVGLNRKGVLVLELDNGEMKEIISGECIIKDS